MKYEQYAQVQALNWSTLKEIHVSPRMLRWREKHPRPDTAAFALGRALHCAVLEPERFRAAYVVRPDSDGRTKEGKAKLAFWRETMPPGAEEMSAGDAETIDLCVAAISAHPHASAALHGARNEEVVCWTDAETSIRCKGRLDLVAAKGIVDLKSTRRQTAREFSRDSSALLYHGQLAWYHDGMISAGLLPPDATLPLIVAVQTVEPYDVSVWRMTAACYAEGHALWRMLLTRYATCVAVDHWPGIAPDVLDLDVEPWASISDPETGEM